MSTGTMDGEAWLDWPVLESRARCNSLPAGMVGMLQCTLAESIK